MIRYQKNLAEVIAPTMSLVTTPSACEINPRTNNRSRTMNALSRLILVVVSTVAFAWAGPALASNWDGGGDGTTWTDVGNWDGSGLPSATQAANINIAAGVVLSSGAAETANGLNLAGAGVTASLSISGAGTSLDLNNSNINIATNSSSAVGTLNLTGVTMTNVGTSGTTNNRWGKNGGKATVNMDASTLSHSVGVNGRLDLMEDGVAGARVTFKLLNSSQFNWQNGDLQIGVSTSSNDYRANFNIDATSSMSFDNGLLSINGAESGGMAVYDIPLGSSSGQAGKMYFKNGISGIASTSSGANVSQVTVNIDSTASDYVIGPDTFKRAASALPISFNNSGFNMANGTNTVGVLNLKGVTLTNVGTAGTTNNRLANATGANATIDMDGASLTHNPAAAFNSDLDLVTSGGNGARATLNLRNGSFIDWQGTGNSSLQVDLSAPAGVNARAFLNVDSTSYMNFSGGLLINGGESGGMATYTIPMASSASTPGKMFFGRGLTGLAYATGSQVTVNIDSTAPDYLFGGNTYKAAASAAPINFNNSGFNIGQNTGSIAVLNLKQVTLNNVGTAGTTNNRPGNSGGQATVFMDASTLTETAAGTNLDAVNNGTTGGRFTLSLINGSHFNWGNGSMTIAANAGSTVDSRANFNIDATSKISFPTGGLIANGGDLSASGGIAVYNLPLTSTSGALGKLYVQNGIQNIANVTNSKVTVNVDSTAPDYIIGPNTFKAAASASINANNSGLNVGTGSNTQGRLNLTSTNYSNVNEVEIGRNGGSGTLGLTTATLAKNGSNSFYNGFDTNTSTKAQILMDNGMITVASGQSFFNRNATTSAATMGSQVKGTGLISFTSGGTFRNNGRVEADGGLFSITGATIDSTLELIAQVNTGFYGQNGWYASAGTGTSKLTLPTLTSVGAGKTWGENSADTTPDLVNAVRFYNVSGLTDNTIDGSLLAVDHGSIPAGLINPIGVWEFSTTGLLTSAEMTIRYDDLAPNLGSIGGGEAALKLFHYDGSMWVNITDGSVDTVNKLIDSVAFNSFSPFAVAEDAQNFSAVPEPSTYALGLLGMVGMGLFVWRRKYRRT